MKLEQVQQLDLKSKVKLLQERFALRSMLGAEDLYPIPPAVLDTGNKLPGVTYSIFQMNDAPEDLKEKVEKGKELLEKFLSVAGAIVQNEADVEGNPELVQSADTWSMAFGFLTDFFQTIQNGKRIFKQTTEGVEVARSSLDFACRVIASDIGDFQNYLMGVSNVLSKKAQETDTSQTMLYTFCQHNLFTNSSGVVFYQPQISFAHTTFSLEESKHLGVCKDTHKVHLDLKVNQMILQFDINSYMSDKDFAKDCDDFLKDFRSKSLADKKTTLKERFERVKEKKNQPELV
ncbi:TPA: hypothetical protein ACVU1I_002165 [Vibrio cholerae]